jgi:hypothetical protein
MTGTEVVGAVAVLVAFVMGIPASVVLVEDRRMSQGPGQ